MTQLNLLSCITDIYPINWRPNRIVTFLKRCLPLIRPCPKLKLYRRSLPILVIISQPKIKQFYKACRFYSLHRCRRCCKYYKQRADLYAPAADSNIFCTLNVALYIADLSCAALCSLKSAFNISAPFCSARYYRLC